MENSDIAFTKVVDVEPHNSQLQLIQFQSLPNGVAQQSIAVSANVAKAAENYRVRESQKLVKVKILSSFVFFRSSEKGEVQRTWERCVPKRATTDRISPFNRSDQDTVCSIVR